MLPDPPLLFGGGSGNETIATVEGTQSGGKDAVLSYRFANIVVVFAFEPGLYWDGHHMLQLPVAVLCTAHTHDLVVFQCYLQMLLASSNTLFVFSFLFQFLIPFFLDFLSVKVSKHLRRFGGLTLGFDKV